jgi:alkaline phosphatase
MHGSQRRYGPPRVYDYGSLTEITADLHPVVGAGASDLSFSSPYPHGVASGGGGYDPGGGGGVGGASASGGGSSGGGGGHGGGGGGGSLPFTGLAVGAVAAAGSALTAAGAALRRFARRRGDG